ncbi:bifunctional hydroxymethylpyrimidine kinase/phosphomethylpyrimidine kinase [Apilactobacillus sp. TMW 2.2459]|uniref:bifunctional hydroxymethylpyrimidine kinase/phosphomethylpyrimidine kinase n=1 Tax=Apilactobacillus xinyiensis TaxID=2841032 RepID=UPI00200E2499|nr:bifunctional hydroxymethylpyrimidine kinase/phosphomethylpyrimidine kinase [Apilactobacillus xinyiensis]MCL0312161.1 bifunctional hydroxymethylpyrimidine kinase/phosphomethylpyrimidine kinase [Apilactobacillus xinyiensis]
MNNLTQYPEALTIAGNDSGGGAGMEADIKTMQACKVFSTNVLVGITAQNTLGVDSIYPLPKEIINKQFESVFEDFDIKATKTGALFDTEHVKIVAKNIIKYNINNLVLDPVMIAKGGATLLTKDAIMALKKELIPLAYLITPNLPEAELLSSQKINNKKDIEIVAEKLQADGAKNVIIKGGHSNDENMFDFVKIGKEPGYWLHAKRIKTIRTHGTGDTLSSAITAFLAKGKSLKEAIYLAHEYLEKIIKKPLLIGHGHGPLNHGSW